MVIRTLALIAILTLPGCTPVGLALIGTCLTIVAQAIGVTAQVETLVRNTILDLHPVKACPVPAEVKP